MKIMIRKLVFHISDKSLSLFNMFSMFTNVELYIIGKNIKRLGIKSLQIYKDSFVHSSSLQSIILFISETFVP